MEERIEHRERTEDHVNPHVEVLVDAESCAHRAAERLAEWILAVSAVDASGVSAQDARVHLMLAGGSTPRRCYELLATHTELPWHRVQVWVGDERRVPPDDPQRNVRLIEETLVAAGRLTLRSVHTIGRETEAKDDAAAEDAARAYEQLLPPRLDVLLLGVGADGHTASLFPGSPALGERSRRVVSARAPVAPHGRWTITPPVIEAARRVLVLASGAEKARAVAAALQGPRDVQSCPAQLARDGIWILDHAAAAGLDDVDTLPP